MRRVWLAELLGPLNHTGRCSVCRGQFLSRNVYVWVPIDPADPRKFCSNRCVGGSDAA